MLSFCFFSFPLLLFLFFFWPFFSFDIHSPLKISRDSSGFYWVLLGFTGFCSLPGLPSFTGFYKLLLGFRGFYELLRFSLGFEHVGEVDRVLLGFTDDYRVSYWSLLFWRLSTF